MLLNQLQQLGARTHAEIPSRWLAILADANLERYRRGFPPVELSWADATVDAYVNRGAWVADCLCNGGIAVSPEFPACACLDCGRIYTPRVPDQAQIDAATVLLERRSVVNRNWYPATEPIRLLQAENAVHGLDDSVDAEDPYNTVAFLEPPVVSVRGALRPGSLNLPLGVAR